MIVTMRIRLFALVMALSAGAAVLGANDWPEWRGPNRDGSPPRRTCPSAGRPRARTSPGRLPFGGALDAGHLRQPALPAERRASTRRTRGDAGAPASPSTPTAGKRRVGEALQRLPQPTCPQHRVGWASPSVDRATGNIYAFRVGAELTPSRRPASLLWERSLPEEFGAIPTHGGRTRVARHRGRPRHRQHADSSWARSGPARQPLLRVRQAHRADDLDQLAADEALRHELLDARRARRSTAAAADRGRHATAPSTRSRQRPASPCGTSRSASARS